VTGREASVRTRAFAGSAADSVPQGPSGDITSSLIGHWTFDESSGATATDSSGFGNGGILVNGPIRTSGKIGQALSLDGVDDSVDLAGSFTSRLSSTAGTIAMWVKLNAVPNTVNDNRYLFASQGAGAHNPSHPRTSRRSTILQEVWSRRRLLAVQQ
jgi:hypothetical protein